MSLRPAQPIRQLSGGPPGPRQPPFGAGHVALSTGLWLPLAFRLVAFASWAILFPLRVWAVLPKIVRLTGPRARPHRGCHVPHQLRRGGGGCLLYCATWVPRPVAAIAAGRCQTEEWGSDSWSVDRRVSHRLRRLFVTPPRRRFTRVHPSRLSLARFAWMVQARLGLHPSALARLVTEALAWVRNRPGHWSGQL